MVGLGNIDLQEAEVKKNSRELISCSNEVIRSICKDLPYVFLTSFYLSNPHHESGNILIIKRKNY